jgi:hypothetical protein
LHRGICVQRHRPLRQAPNGCGTPICDEVFEDIAAAIAREMV